MKRNSITIFDVDDTLVITKSKIKVHNPKTGFKIELTPQQFNTFKTRPNDKLDFSDFQSLDILKAGKIIEWVFSILKRTILKGKPVGIITARDDSSLIQQFLGHNGININPNYIFAINDPVLKFKGSTAEKKREAFKQFMDMGFNDFTFFDDDRENINIANSLNKEPGIKMKAKLIKQKWIPKFEDFK
jgi:hypothetical protein|tara:strand:+ start:743 stop:1306 length:564 start_codon:yes stop_codon:yes gene_type:complete